VFAIIGDSATILPLVGPEDNPDPTSPTFITRRGTGTGLEATFTWSEAASAFDTPLDLAGTSSLQGIIPFVTFNGTDEGATSPDAAYWFRDDANGEAWSLGAWINIPATVSPGVILAKDDVGGDNRGWDWELGSNRKIRMILIDHSAGVLATRLMDSALPSDTWLSVAMTYDGGGGATAADGITLYLNGAVTPSTGSNNASYVALEDLPSAVTLAFRWSDFFTGRMAGGAMGPFFTPTLLSPAEVAAWHDIGRAAMELPP
jgi:hypothetical protein